jgi:CTP synthase (UTP-ammonia lyase)
MYKQSLYEVIEPHIKPKIINRMNRYKKWTYGYNKEHDVIVISKDGTIGDIYEIQNLKIALPKLKNIHSFEFW